MRQTLRCLRSMLAAQLREQAPLLRRLLAGEDLSRDEAADFIGDVMDANYTPTQAAGLLVALAAKGESVDEIVGAARAMRERSLRVEHRFPMVVDVVGTGGDHANTINISTMAALVVATAGIPVAKHGNRAASSACGSADVLEAVGLPIELSPEGALTTLRRSGFTFMFAPRYHPAMRNVGPVRRELGVRTIFNLLGPLCNPAGATHLVVGVARASLVESIGNALRALGARRGAVIHGCNGVDEVVGDAPTLVYSFDEEQARLWRLEPSAYGVSVPLDDIVGGSMRACRDTFLSVLSGESSQAATVVALNAALVLYAIGVEARLEHALERAKSLLKSGAALRTLERAKAIARLST
jgi:anthranilate phosphoribosyltransferase